MNTKRLPPETIIRLLPQLENLREIDKTLTESEADMRRLIEDPSENLTVELIQEHVRIMQQFFARTERNHRILVELSREGNLDDPVTTEFIQLFANRINQKDEILAYWQRVLDTKLS